MAVLSTILIALGVGREDRVALTGQRSIELVVGMLATLKAGVVTSDYRNNAL